MTNSRLWYSKYVILAPRDSRIRDAIDKQDSLMSDGFEEVCRRYCQYSEKPTDLGYFRDALYAWDSDTMTDWVRDTNGVSPTLA
jgi:hypothetical protein